MRSDGRAPLLRRLKQFFQPLVRTPFHPQWLLTIGGGPGVMHWLREVAPPSVVFDVGCASQWPRSILHEGCGYWGLDFPTTAARYGTRPHIYADAHRPPLRPGVADVVLLLDVLEHLSDPEAALRQIHQVLRPGGRVILKVPFLYPLHDAPHDHTRWTRFGLLGLARRTGFTVRAEAYLGEPLMTAALLWNIALTHTVVAAFERRMPALLLAPLVPVAVLVVNLTAYVVAKLGGRSDLMPFAYQGVWIKSPQGHDRQ